MKKNCPPHWTLQMAFDIIFAPVWYYSDTKQRHFYYRKIFTTDFTKNVIPNGRILTIRPISNNPIFTTTGGF